MQSVVGGGLTSDRRVFPCINNNAHRKIEGAGEVQVTLIVRGHRHNRPGAVIGEHIIRRPDWNSLTIHRVDRIALQENTCLLAGGIEAIHFRCLLDLFQILREFGLCGSSRSQFGGQIRVRSHYEKRRAVQRVRTRRVHRYRLIAALDYKIDLSASGATDPVALHEQNLFRPCTFQLLHIVQEPICVIGDLEIPLGQLLLCDVRVTPLTLSGDNLFVC